MIFPEDQIKPILAGKVTTTTLPIHHRSVGGIHRCPVREGGSYRLRVRIAATDEQPSETRTTEQWLHVLSVVKDSTARVWVVTFERGKVQERRLLSATCKAMDADDEEKLTPAQRIDLEHGDDARGYTTATSKALHDAGECVDDDVLDLYARENHMRQAGNRDAHNDELLSAKLALEARMRRARRLASERGIPVSPELRVIERQVERIERKIREQHSRRAA
jgi:hypothetical protein